MTDLVDGMLDETEYDSIPPEWALARFEDMVSLQRGKDLSIQLRKPGPYPVVGSNGVVGYHNQFVSDGPGVTVGRSGSVGKLTFVKGPFWPLNTSLWVKDFHGNDPTFVYNLLQTFDFDRYATGVSVPTLNRNYLSDVKLLLPPLPEQRRIAHVLSTIQRAIQAQHAVIAAARELKRSLMQRLFTYGPYAEPLPTKETDFGEVPLSWPEVGLEHCAKVQTGVAKGRKLDGADTVELPYLRVANVQDGYLDLDEIKTLTILRTELHRFRLQDRDVLLTEGGDFDKLGRGFIWRNQLDPCIHQNHIFAVRTDRSLLLPEYFSYLVQSIYGKRYFLKVAHRTTNLASINSTKLKALPVLLASMDEQKAVVNMLEQVDFKVAMEERRGAALEALFKSMLHQLMAGQVRVPVADFGSRRLQ